MFGGIWGTIAVGLFDNEKGLLYGADGSGTFFGY
jgi:ammonia channel protein AmtB